MTRIAVHAHPWFSAVPAKGSSQTSRPCDAVGGDREACRFGWGSCSRRSSSIASAVFAAVAGAASLLRTNTLLTNLNAEKLSPTAPIFLRGSISRSKKSRLKDLNPEVFMDESPLRAMRDAFAADGSLSAAEANRQGSSAPRHCLLPSRAWT